MVSYSCNLDTMEYEGDLKGLSRKNERGLGWNLNTLGVDREFYLMFLSREIDTKLCQIYTKTVLYQFLEIGLLKVSITPKVLRFQPLPRLIFP